MKKWRGLCFFLVFIDLKQRSYEDVYFVTDNIYCGRGFRLYFQQVQCNTYVTTTPKMTTTVPDDESCGGELNSLSFEITISKRVKDCTYVIRRFNQVKNLSMWTWCFADHKFIFIVEIFYLCLQQIGLESMNFIRSLGLNI